MKVQKDVNKNAVNNLLIFTALTHYLSPNSCHPKNQTKNILIGVADRIRRDYSDNIMNDITYRIRTIEYKTYLINLDIVKKI